MRRLKLAGLRWQYGYWMAQAYLAQFTDDALAVVNFENMAHTVAGRIDRLRIQP
jgi:multidrug resistance efflux pump